MSSLNKIKSYKEVLEAIEDWSSDTKLRLIQELLGTLIPNSSGESSDPSDQKYRKGRRWREIAGAASYPMVGEDAQDWVTRTRQEGDEHRAKIYNHVELAS